LWDNGNTPAEELQNVMQVRKTAISQFSKDNIRAGEPYTVLEDVFVPLYFYHRYQVEAAVKVIGGADYNYASRGDDQEIVKSVSPELQLETLVEGLNSCKAEALAIPESLLELFPPRAYGYYKTRESFKGKTGLTFDPVSAANTSCDFTLRLLLLPERMNRVVLQSALSSKQLELKDVFSLLIKSSFEASYDNKYKQLVQRQFQMNTLKYLMNLAVSDKSFTEVKALANETIETIVKDFLMKSQNVENKEFLRLIKNFMEKPEDFKLNSAPKIPDGSPIGMDICNYNSY
jgi:hypothetical protein